MGLQKIGNQHLVYYYGTNDYGLAKPSQIKDYDSFREEFKNQKIAKKYKESFPKAMELGDVEAALEKDKRVSWHQLNDDIEMKVSPPLPKVENIDIENGNGSDDYQEIIDDDEEVKYAKKKKKAGSVPEKDDEASDDEEYEDGKEVKHAKKKKRTPKKNDEACTVKTTKVTISTEKKNSKRKREKEDNKDPSKSQRPRSSISTVPGDLVNKKMNLIGEESREQRLARLVGYENMIFLIKFSLDKV